MKSGQNEKCPQLNVVKKILTSGQNYKWSKLKEVKTKSHKN